MILIHEISYDRVAAVAYARQWAFARNPRFFNFDGVGGDCTNFISQCIFAGCGVMNYTRDVGWYYNSPHDRAAGWSGVPYLHQFLLYNKKTGPYAVQTDSILLQPGDVIQLGHLSGPWYHSLFVIERDGSELLVATHSEDAYMRPLSSYRYDQARFLQIAGARSY